MTGSGTKEGAMRKNCDDLDNPVLSDAYEGEPDLSGKEKIAVPLTAGQEPPKPISDKPWKD